MNYALKSPKYSYEKEFDRIRKQYDLKGQIKTVSNIVLWIYNNIWQTIFFEEIGQEETKRYF